MKLVYLDTSNFSLLSEIQQKFPEKLKSFLKTWRENNYILALSETNIFEIARKGFNESRYNLLKEFRPIRFESRIFPKEIIKALKHKRIYNFFINNYDFCRPMFYEVISTSNRLHFLCDSAKNGYQLLANRGYELSEISWQSKKNFSTTKNNRKFRLGDLSDSPSDLSSIELKKYLEKIITIFEKGREVHPGMKQLKFLHSRLEEVGPQQAFAELAGVDINRPLAKVA